jgi:signal-transduction protein with cAMP-binding, CBS, and nucleotidyltransferase domain
LAFHITDDRYDHVSTVPTQVLDSDDFDTNAWLVSVRQSVQLDEIKDEMMGEVNERASLAFDVGDESMPPAALRESVRLNAEAKSCPAEAAVVATDTQGNVYVRWLHPDVRRKWVHVAAVMNRGTYCVTDTMPVSKAHHLFTLLGLRHLVVLGEGGAVCGIVTRINLLKEFITERTGTQL